MAPYTPYVGLFSFTSVKTEMSSYSVSSEEWSNLGQLEKKSKSFL